MADLFDEVIFCSNCGKKMSKITIIKNGFRIRSLKCSKCNKIINHPSDLEKYKKFIQLKQKPFTVKLRIVGNSYTVSIPKEIIEFHKEQERMHQKFIKMRDEMIRVFLEDVGKISLFFPSLEEKKGINNKILKDL